MTLLNAKKVRYINRMAEVFVSVIVPIYNVEKYIDECLVHLEHQTLKEIEVILVNDGSTDSSPKIAQRYVDRNNNFRLINRTNGGVSAARNTGMKYAVGKYLYFIDSDDYLADTALYELFQVAEQNQLDVLKFSAYTFEENSTDFKWEGYKYKGNYDGIYTGIQLLKETQDNHDDIVNCGMVFIRRALVVEKQLHFSEGIIYSEDTLFHFILLALSQRAMVLNKPLHYRRYRATSVTQAVDHYQNFRGNILNARAADIFLEKHSNIKKQGLEWYLYGFLDRGNDSYRHLERSQRKKAEFRKLYKIDRALLFKYRRVDVIKAMLFIIHPQLAWLYADAKEMAYKISAKILRTQ